MNYIQFSQNIKKKYPQYNDMEDLDLAKKMVAKFPQYNDVSFDDAGKNEQPQEKKSIVDSVIDKVGDGVSIIKDMYNKANNVVTEPVVDSAKNINAVTDTVKKAVNPVSVLKKVADSATVREYNNIEPVLRARTKEDDNAKVIYEPDSFDILGNKIAVASAGGSVDNIEQLKKLKDKQKYAILTAQLPTHALTVEMSITVLA